jgi:hypothetical protein
VEGFTISKESTLTPTVVNTYFHAVYHIGFYWNKGDYITTYETKYKICKDVWTLSLDTSSNGPRRTTKYWHRSEATNAIPLSVFTMNNPDTEYCTT